VTAFDGERELLRKRGREREAEVDRKIYPDTSVGATVS
jgi:hypothetical protein